MSDKPIVNTSGLQPCGYAVLCLPYEPEFAKSVIIIPPTAQERSRMVEDRAVVIALGSEVWADESQPRAKVGDKVLLGKFSGNIVIGPNDGVKSRMINGGDIYAVITQERETDK